MWSKALKVRGARNGRQARQERNRVSGGKPGKRSRDDGRHNGRRARASETAYGCMGGAKLCRENPKSGTGMKKGQQTWGGSKRQGVLENPKAQGARRWNVGLFERSRCPMWENAEGAKRP